MAGRELVINKRIYVNIYWGNRRDQYTGNANDRKNPHVYLGYDLTLVMHDIEQDQVGSYFPVDWELEWVDSGTLPGTNISIPSIYWGIDDGTAENRIVNPIGLAFYVSHDIFPETYGTGSCIKTFELDASDEYKEFNGWVYDVAMEPSTTPYPYNYPVYTNVSWLNEGYQRAVFASRQAVSAAQSAIWQGDSSDPDDKGIRIAMVNMWSAQDSNNVWRKYAAAKGIVDYPVGTLGDDTSMSGTCKFYTTEFDQQTGRYIGPPFLATVNHFVTTSTDKWLTSTVDGFISRGMLPNDSCRTFAEKYQYGDNTYHVDANNCILAHDEIFVVQGYYPDFEALVKYRPGANYDSIRSEWLSHDRDAGNSLIWEDDGWSVIDNIYNPVAINDDINGIIRIDSEWKPMLRIGSD